MSVLLKKSESRASSNGSFINKKKERVLTRPGELDNHTAMNVNRQRPRGLVIDGGSGKKVASQKKLDPMLKRESPEILPNKRRMEKLEVTSFNIKKKPTNFMYKSAPREESVMQYAEEPVPPTVPGAQVESAGVLIIADDSSCLQGMKLDLNNETMADKELTVPSLSSGEPPSSDVRNLSSGSTSPESICDTVTSKPETEPLPALTAAPKKISYIDDLEGLPHIDLPEVTLSEVPKSMRNLVQQQPNNKSKIVFQPIKLLHSLYERGMLSSAELEFMAMVVDVERILGRLQDEWLRRRESWNDLGFVPFKGTQLDNSTAYPQSVLAADIWMNNQLRENVDMDLFHSLPRYRPVSIAEERNFQFLVMKSTVEVLRTLLVDLRKHLATSILNMQFIMTDEGAYNLDIVFLHSPTNDVLLGPDGLVYLSVMENGDKLKKYWMIRSQTPDERQLSKKYYKQFYDDSSNWLALQDWIKEWLDHNPDLLNVRPRTLKIFSTWKDIQKSSYYQSVAVQESKRVKIKNKLTRTSKT